MARCEYNGRGERVANQTLDEAFLYAFDESGQLIGRYVPEGATDWRIDEEILWLENTPIASVRIDNGQPLLDDGGDFADGVIAHEGAWLGGETFVSFDKVAVARLAANGSAARLLDDPH